MSHSPSFYWFDYETFGTHPAWDRPCQFAGIRTDMDLVETGEPLVIYCQQSMDYLPNPAACKVTGITPQLVNEQGFSENRFIEQILEQIGKPGTCSLGYNSIRFDDEFTRHTLFRNFLDPYEYEYKDGNSRWDLLDIVRLTRALRPEGIQWPVNEDGSPSNRLEHLSVANDIEHALAHDALSDVRATIGMARLIRTAQPKLFNFAFEHRTKHAVSRLLNTREPRVCLQVSGMIPATRSHISPVLPLTAHPDNRNSVIVIDLHQDPSELLTMNADEIAHRLFTRSDPDDPTHGSVLRPGLRTVQINKCPVIVPLNTLRALDAERLGFDLQLIQAHEQIARKLLDPEILRVIVEAMTRVWPESHTDVEGTLYSGPFMTADDRQRASHLRNSDPHGIAEASTHFDDKRLLELAWRYQARHYPETLDNEQRQRWQEHCHKKLTQESSPWLTFETFDAEMGNMNWDSSDAGLKEQLEAYKLIVAAHAGVTL